VILQQVQTLSQLVTVKYVMEKVVILNDIQPYKEFFIPGSGREPGVDGGAWNCQGGD